MYTGEKIRPECLRPAADNWEHPTGAEVREVIRRAGMTGAQTAKYLGISAQDGGRNVRKWISGETKIAYSAWALLCHAAGLGMIWVASDQPKVGMGE